MNGFYLATTNQSVYIPESKHHHGHIKGLEKLQIRYHIREFRNYISNSKLYKKFFLLCYVEEVKEIQYSYIATWGDKAWFRPSPTVSKCMLGSTRIHCRSNRPSGHASAFQCYSQLNLILQTMCASSSKNTLGRMKSTLPLQRGATIPEKTNYLDRCEFAFGIFKSHSIRD